MRRASWTVLELTLLFRYEWKNLNRRDVVRINRAINRTIIRSKHTPHTISVLVITTETAQQLMDRTAPAFETISVVDYRWCQTVGRDAVGQLGDGDPFRTHVLEAWGEADKRNKPKHLRQPRALDIFVKHGINELDRSAAIKMGLRGPRKRKPTPDPNGPHR